MRSGPPPWRWTERRSPVDAMTAILVPGGSSRTLSPKTTGATAAAPAGNPAAAGAGDVAADIRRAIVTPTTATPATIKTPITAVRIFRPRRPAWSFTSLSLHTGIFLQCGQPSPDFLAPLAHAANRLYPDTMPDETARPTPASLPSPPIPAPPIPAPAIPAPAVLTIATEAAAGQRVDRFLADVIGTLSRSRVKALIEAGHVLRDGVRLSEPAEAVRTGATYMVRLPDPVAAAPRPQNIDFTILHEDSDLIVLDKQAGLVVHPAPGNADGTLVNALLAHCGDTLPGIGGERRPGIIHRLDKDTSGVMVVAKTEQALGTLSAAFAARTIERAYLALCWGLPSPPAGEISGAIGRDPRDRKRMAVVKAGGKIALTHYKTLRSWRAAVALSECRLATGRTHQIRVHMAQAGHPLVGDPLYLRRTPTAARQIAEPVRSVLLDFPRQALHAATLGFRHPRTGAAMRFETRPPPDFLALVDMLDAQT